MNALKKTRPKVVTLALLVGTFLASLDANVVGTSLPSIVAQLGGLALYGLVFSVYLLTSTITVPIYGSLADLYGRKPIYLTATAFFLIGSALCGAATSMPALIIFRAIQGLGAGGIIPITLTLFGDLFEAKQRAFVQGLFSTVWGISSVLGPLAGGFFVTYATWRWIFWLNLPIGVLSAALVSFNLDEKKLTTSQQGKPDVRGAVLLALGLGVLLWSLQEFEKSLHQIRNIGLLGLALFFIALFIMSQKRASRPLLPLDIFRIRALAVTAASGIPLGGVLFSVTVFVPLFVQGVLHQSPTRAGMALVPLSLMWTLMTFLIGGMCKKWGYKPVILLGGALLLGGTAALAMVSDTATLPFLYVTMAMTGCGMGLTIAPMTIAVQDSVPWHQRGVATSLMQFFRTVGGMIMVTFLSVIVTSRFSNLLSPKLPEGMNAAELLDAKRWQALPPTLLKAAGLALKEAVGSVFITVLCLASVFFLIVFGFPRLRMKHPSNQADVQDR